MLTIHPREAVSRHMVIAYHRYSVIKCGNARKNLVLGNVSWMLQPSVLSVEGLIYFDSGHCLMTSSLFAGQNSHLIDSATVAMRYQAMLAAGLPVDQRAEGIHCSSEGFLLSNLLSLISVMLRGRSHPLAWIIGIDPVRFWTIAHCTSIFAGPESVVVVARYCTCSSARQEQWRCLVDACVLTSCPDSKW